MPTLLTGAGIFLLIFGLLALLPGRDTAAYLAGGNARSINDAMASPAASRSAILPSRESIVLVCGPYYHWDPQCKLMAHRPHGVHLQVTRMTRAQAEAEGFQPCGYCDEP